MEKKLVNNHLIIDVIIYACKKIKLSRDEHLQERKKIMGERVYGSFNDLVNLKPKRGGKFFSLKNGEEARVRFLYNRLEDDMHFFWVHELQNAPYTTYVCPNQTDEKVASCKWCEEHRDTNPRVARVILALYNLDANEIQYWKRTYQFTQERVIPLLQEIENNGQPCSAQVYKIKRMGDSRDTTYTVIPTGQMDRQSHEMFGTVEDAYDLNIIFSDTTLEHDYTYSTVKETIDMYN